MPITIYQGRKAPRTVANTTIVIDVIRAFTVAHYAFLQGVNRIFLADSVNKAFQIKRDNPEYLLAGEVDGLPIDGFDLDNSPFHIQQHDLFGKTLVQKTTNGIRATLNCLASKNVFVTGFTNAKTTAEFIREKIIPENQESIHIIASHPSGDDDFACAEYMKSILEGSNSIPAADVIERIKQSHVAEKFFNEDYETFRKEDIAFCIKELNSDFVMRVNKHSKLPMIERLKYDRNRINFTYKGSETKRKWINDFN